MLDREHLGLLDVTTRRNAFGRQVHSFEADLELDGIDGGPLRGVFIRAPWVEEAGDGVEVLAELDGHPVAVREGEILAVAFHPEIHGDSRLHRWLIARAGERNGDIDTVRDHRAESLAQILVRYSTKVQEGDTCIISGTARRGAAAAGRVRGGAEGRRAADRPDDSRRGARRLLPAGLRRPAGLGRATVGVGGGALRRAHRRDGRRQLARALRRGPQEAGARPEGAQADHGDHHAAGGRGRAPLGAHAVSHARLRERGRHVAHASTRTSTTRPAWPPTTIP